MKTFNVLSVATLLAAAATPLTALASDQPGTTADQWKEETSGATGINGSPDAGQILAHANLTRGAGPLNFLTGTLVNNRDVDLYCISISNPAAFSATSTADVAGYNGLWLFNSTGHAVAGYLGDGSMGHTIATIGAGAATGATPGLFYLAVTRSDFGFGSVDQFPLSATNASLFNTATNSSGPYGAMGPNPSVTDPLDHWNANPSPGFDLFNTPYTITLTGAGYHTTPAPGACALLGLGGLALSRRRR
ncbi:MAG TPA: MYXO-CTERM sorting domain-containing protein [Phycisphaerales bacterium]|nr:MYXO-CTERM sorting domain-containing protein [Phycisphaerales bacterium]